MKKNNSPTKILIGLMVLAAGSILLLRSLGVLEEFAHWGEFWTISAGVIFTVTGFSAILKKNPIWGVIFLMVGVTLVIMPFVDFKINAWGLVTSALVVMAGFSLIFGKSFGGASALEQKKVESGQSVTTILSGKEVLTGSKFGGMSLITVLGGTDIDMRDSNIKDKAVIDVTTVLGGVEIRVPSDVEVEDETSTLLGGVENKSRPSKTAKKKLYIRGTIIMGGVEIK